MPAAVRQLSAWLELVQRAEKVVSALRSRRNHTHEGHPRVSDATLTGFCACARRPAFQGSAGRLVESSNIGQPEADARRGSDR